MNRQNRRAAASAARRNPRPHPHGFNEPARDRIARARSDRYATFAASPEHTAKLRAIEDRIAAELNDISAWDGMCVFLTLSSMFAALGVRTDVDELGALSCEEFLKNCREHYKQFEKHRLEGGCAS